MSFPDELDLEDLYQQGDAAIYVEARNSFRDGECPSTDVVSFPQPVLVFPKYSSDSVTKLSDNSSLNLSKSIHGFEMPFEDGDDDEAFKTIMQMSTWPESGIFDSEAIDVTNLTRIGSISVDDVQKVQNKKKIHSSLGTFTYPETFISDSDSTKFPEKETTTTTTTTTKAVEKNKVSFTKASSSEKKSLQPMTTPIVSSKDNLVASAPPPPPPPAKTSKTQADYNNPLNIEAKELIKSAYEHRMQELLVDYANIHGSISGNAKKKAKALQWANQVYYKEQHEVRTDRRPKRKRKKVQRFSGNYSSLKKGIVCSECEFEGEHKNLLYQCSSCSQRYHASCANQSARTIVAAGKSWVCRKCVTLSLHKKAGRKPPTKPTAREFASLEEACLDSDNDDFCFKCHYEGDENNPLFCCDNCPNSYHANCAKEPDLLNKENCATEWYCPHCKEYAEDAFECDKEMEDEDYEDELKQSSKLQAALLEERKHIKETMNSLTGTFDTYLLPLVNSSCSNNSENVLASLESETDFYKIVLKQDPALVQSVADIFLSQHPEAEDDLTRVLKILELKRVANCGGGGEESEIVVDTAESDVEVVMKSLKSEVESLPSGDIHKLAMDYILKYLVKVQTQLNPDVFYKYLLLAESLNSREGIYSEDQSKAMKFLSKVKLAYPDGKSKKAIQKLIKNTPIHTHAPIPKESTKGPGQSSFQESEVLNNNNSNENNNNNKRKRKTSSDTSESSSDSDSDSDMEAESATITSNSLEDAKKFDTAELEALLSKIPIPPKVPAAEIRKTLLAQQKGKFNCAEKFSGSRRLMLFTKCRRTLKPASTDQDWERLPAKASLQAAVKEVMEGKKKKNGKPMSAERFVRHYVGWALWRPDNKTSPSVLACLYLGLKKEKRLIVIPKHLFTKLFPSEEKHSALYNQVKESAVERFLASFDPVTRTFAWIPTWELMQKANMIREVNPKDKADLSVKKVPVIDSRRLVDVLKLNSKTIISKINETHFLSDDELQPKQKRRRKQADNSNDSSSKKKSNGNKEVQEPETAPDSEISEPSSATSYRDAHQDYLNANWKQLHLMEPVGSIVGIETASVNRLLSYLRLDILPQGHDISNHNILKQKQLGS